MYTQCPDCGIAFKVTAKVLKQAAGKVRCGGCGNAFDALSYLSEKKLKQSAAGTTDQAVPELKPEIIETDDGLPPSISAEQNAALLKTLDELAGSDIRIEDTGVEWRVIDEEEAAELVADNDNAGQVNATKIDETLDASATPIDEVLTKTPNIVDEPEIFEEPADGPSKRPIDELRFDDNTPLPDNFDLDDESSHIPEKESEPEPEKPEAETARPQADLVLSEPDEWQDILGEFQESAEEVAARTDATVADTDDAKDDGDIEAESESEPESESGDPLDMDTQFALQAEAMGIDLSGIDELDEEEDSEDDDEFGEDTAHLDILDEQVEPIVESHRIEDELAGLNDEEKDEHYVPSMTDEEHTANMQIDQDLMALSSEDEDGFASTIVIPENDTEKKALEENLSAADGDLEDELEHELKHERELEDLEHDSGFETIVMEGESIRAAIDSKKLAKNSAAAAKLAELARVEEAEQANHTDRRRYGFIGGIAVLVLLLILQMMHQSREALATIPAFSGTIGQVYRAFGQPVQPAWDITGWRFEATKGSTQGDDEELTIYSRVGNNSDSPLPYPLIGISLTDRFEETIGSRVLDPTEYLPTDLDPGEMVAPGNTFNAVITIKSASEDATGFKLNVCYRLSDGQLRCAIDDFK